MCVQWRKGEERRREETKKRRGGEKEGEEDFSRPCPLFGFGFPAVNYLELTGMAFGYSRSISPVAASDRNGQESSATGLTISPKNNGRYRVNTLIWRGEIIESRHRGIRKGQLACGRGVLGFEPDPKDARGVELVVGELVS